MGANDLCGWNGGLTPTATFRAQFTETLDILRAGLPGTRVLVASIPNLYQLWSVLRTDPVARVVWQAAGSLRPGCPHHGVERGDYSGTIPWEEIAKGIDLPSAYGSQGPGTARRRPPELRGYVDGVVAFLRVDPAAASVAFVLLADQPSRPSSSVRDEDFSVTTSSRSRRSWSSST
jgi:hypothetical protein